jgi:hypothetical protein
MTPSMLRNACSVIALGLLCTGLAGCKPLSELKRLLGLNSMPSPVPAPVEIRIMDPSKGRREILAEMFRVVFDTREVADDEFFEGLLSSLHQGASIEGVYRGLIRGQRYRSLEIGSMGADPSQVRFFASEISLLQDSMREPTRFDTKESRGVPTIEYPEEDSSIGSSPAQEPKPRLKKEDLEKALLQDFAGSSHYTLKRILGDEALRKIEELKGSRADLSRWYASTVLRLQKTGVDFGIPLRNSGDFGMHLRFAENMPLDRVIWEVLNRYHRCINALGRR